MAAMALAISEASAVYSANTSENTSAIGGVRKTRRMRKAYDKAMAEADEEERLAAEQSFADFCAEYNKSYATVEEFDMRQGIYVHCDGELHKMNEKAEDDFRTLRVGHNFTSDLTEQEYETLLLGRRTVSLDEEPELDEGEIDMEPSMDQLLRQMRTSIRGSTTSTSTAMTATLVDWAASGNMTPVKDQGKCGSCTMFAATSVLEGQISIASGEDPVRRSEQQLVDCTLDTDENEALFGKVYNNFGCNGGYEDRNFTFMEEQGSMLYDDYPYVSGDTDEETACQHDEDAELAFPTSQGRITTTVGDAVNQLKEGPMTVALHALSPAFRFYKEGILTAKDNC